MRSIYAAGLIALLMAPCAQAQTISRSTLGNGLTVLAVQSDHAQVAGIAAARGRCFSRCSPSPVMTRWWRS